MKIPSAVYRGMTFGKILDLNRGAGPGFDVLRLGLAVLILLTHTAGLTGHSGSTTRILNWLFHLHPAPPSPPAAIAPVGADVRGPALHGLGRPFTLSHVPMFFALSGFLVSGSALRTRNVFRFLGLRALRIVPALFVEVMLSAIVLGAIFTTLPLGQYFSSPGFFEYFLNIIGDIHFKLPGVFANGNVNSNLWTLPGEFNCYLLLALAMIIGLVFNRVVLTALYIAVTIGLLVANVGYDYMVVPAHLPNEVNVYYFFTGVLIFQWRDRIIFHEALFIAAAAICYALMMSRHTVYVYPLLLTYVTAFIGLYPMPQFKLLKTGDYSYGIYLYGYPVTQAVITTFPGIKNMLPLAVLCSVGATCLFAAFSWHAIEKHVLKLKRFISPKSSAITAALHPDTMAGKPSLESIEAVTPKAQTT